MSTHHAVGWGRRWTGLSCLVAIVVAPEAGWGQAASIPTPPSATGEASLSHGYLFDITGFGAELGRSLAAQGVYLHAGMQEATSTVLSGGDKGGTRTFNLARFGFDIDTNAAFGLPGGLLDVTATSQAGNTKSGGNGIGSASLVPFAFGDELRLINFDYSQSFFGHALQITIGRMQPGYTSTPYLSPAFHQAAWQCSFFSTSCGPPYAFSINSSKAPYVVGSWGGFVTLHPAPDWYVRTGVFENQPLEVQSRAHLGWPGRDWGLNEAAGAFLPLQVGYVTTPAQSAYPTSVHLAAYYDSARFPDKLLNSRLQPIAFHPGVPLFDHGQNGVFGGIQQTVLRFDQERESARGVAVFVSFDVDTSNLATVRDQVIAGLIVTGPLASRPADTLNLLASWQSFDPREAQGRDDVAARHHIAYQMRGETGLELNYGLAVSPGATLYPYAQYVKNPDELGEGVPVAGDTRAWAVGLRSMIRFDTLLGLPQPN